MNRALSHLILLGLILGFWQGCRGYEDGPSVSLRTVKNRIVGGWKPTRFTINGIDNLNNLDTMMGANSGSVSTFHFHRHELPDSEANFSFGGRYGIWGLDANNSTLSIYNWANNSIPIIDWEIKKLTRNEMNLEGTSPTGDNYELNLNLIFKPKG